MQPMGRLSMYSKCLDFLSFKFWMRVRFFFIFPLLPTCSFQVLNMFLRFPMCSPRVFPIAPRFNPISFAQSPPLCTYIAGPKEKTLHLSIEFYILGRLRSFNFYLQWANQISSTQKKREKVGLVRHTRLINMKQNKYPQYVYKFLECIHKMKKAGKKKSSLL